MDPPCSYSQVRPYCTNLSALASSTVVANLNSIVREFKQALSEVDICCICAVDLLN